MHDVVDRLVSIKKEIQLNNSKAEVVAISKTFPISKILPLINFGHLHYGENKIQEADDKWSEIKKNYKNLQLHMVGKLQTNKVKKAVKLFDYVHSLDSERLALKISQYQKELNKEIKLFIQVNLGGEKQKSGLALNNLHTFYNYCVNELSLNIIGLMCLPPIDSDSVKYFKLLKKTSENFNLKELSMGMSSDFEDAVINGSTFLRLGTLIFGKRNII